MKIAKYEAQLIGPELPAGGEHLVRWFHDVGPALVGAMGYVPLTYSELRHWSDLVQAGLTPWEAETLRALSRVFCDSRARAEMANRRS